MSPYQFDVEVQPAYVPEQASPEDGVFGFAYTITITNAGSVAAQLVSRHWIICDALGHTEEVKGLGVVGQQPVLRPGESYQYTSGCRLRTPTGTMHGSYHCAAVDGETFSASIPLFLLEATEPGAPGRPQGARVLH